MVEPNRQMFYLVLSAIGRWMGVVWWRNRAVLTWERYVTKLKIYHLK